MGRVGQMGVGRTVVVGGSAPGLGEPCPGRRRRDRTDHGPGQERRQHLHEKGERGVRVTVVQDELRDGQGDADREAQQTSDAQGERPGPAPPVLPRWDQETSGGETVADLLHRRVPHHALPQGVQGAVRRRCQLLEHGALHRVTGLAPPDRDDAGPTDGQPPVRVHAGERGVHHPGGAAAEERLLGEVVHLSMCIRDSDESQQKSEGVHRGHLPRRAVRAAWTRREPRRGGRGAARSCHQRVSLRLAASSAGWPTTSSCSAKPRASRR